MNGKATVDIETSLSGKIIFSSDLRGSLSANENILGAKASISTDHDLYSGAYDVTPEIEEQTLNTSDKLMLDDVKIRAIPYYSVSNKYNGETIIIGGNI